MPDVYEEAKRALRTAIDKMHWEDLRPLHQAFCDQIEAVNKTNEDGYGPVSFSSFDGPLVISLYLQTGWDVHDIEMDEVDFEAVLSHSVEQQGADLLDAVEQAVRNVRAKLQSSA